MGCAALQLTFLASVEGMAVCVCFKVVDACITCKSVSANTRKGSRNGIVVSVTLLLC